MISYQTEVTIYPNLFQSLEFVEMCSISPGPQSINNKKLLKFIFSLSTTQTRDGLSTYTSGTHCVGDGMRFCQSGIG
jgi:hypothetical protein